MKKYLIALMILFILMGVFSMDILGRSMTDIQRRMVGQTNYRINVVKGIVESENINKTYNCYIAGETVIYPNIPTFSRNPKLQPGDKVTIEFINGCRETPAILAPEDIRERPDTTPPITGTWILPTGHIDLGGPRGWWNETRMYDGSLLQSSNYNVGPASWSNFIRLTHVAMRCNAIRLYITYLLGHVDKIDIDAFYGGIWNHIYEGDYDHSCDGVGNPLEWYEVAMGSIQEITEFRIRVYNSDPINNWGCGIFEVEFFEVD